MTKRQRAYVEHTLMRNRGYLIIRGLSEVEIEEQINVLRSNYELNPPRVPTNFKITIKQK